MRVDVLSFEGCPNAGAARALVERVLEDLDVEADVATISVDDLDAAVRLRFLGSPTIRVDGRDVEPGAGERLDYNLSCRVYRTGAGLSNLPPEQWVRSALARAAS